MKPNGLIFLLLHFVYCMAGLTLDDLVEDTSWVSVQNTTHKRIVPKDVFKKLEDGLVQALRKVEIGEIEANGTVDCFGLDPILQYVFQWMFTPMSQETIDTRYYLVTREAPRKTELKNPKTGCFFGNSTFYYRRTVVIVHGFMTDSEIFWMNDMADVFVKIYNYNVIMVDWGGGSQSWKYWRAVANTRVVGRLLAQMLGKLIACGILRRSEIHCVGHSLGSHICSFAARNLGPFDRITGLDPAEPCFHGHGLSATDAKYVDVIHTNTAEFGQPVNVGLKDFYPNGGEYMPGCRIQKGPFLDTLNLLATPGIVVLVDKLVEVICSHGRSYEYFIDSLRYRCKFWGRSWDSTPDGKIIALLKKCHPWRCAPLGLGSVIYPGNGAYFVPTRARTPFCIPEPRVSHTMAVWQEMQQYLN